MPRRRRIIRPAPFHQGAGPVGPVGPAPGRPATCRRNAGPVALLALLALHLAALHHAAGALARRATRAAAHVGVGAGAWPPSARPSPGDQGCQPAASQRSRGAAAGSVAGCRTRRTRSFPRASWWCLCVCVWVGVGVCVWGVRAYLYQKMGFTSKIMRLLLLPWCSRVFLAPGSPAERGFEPGFGSFCVSHACRNVVVPPRAVSTLASAAWTRLDRSSLTEKGGAQFLLDGRLN